MWGWALNEDRIRYKQAAASRHHISYLPPLSRLSNPT